VEDNDLNQIVAAGFLERLGCTLDIAVNGEEAVVMAEGGSYDLIFMDCQMPHMDGYAAAAALRQLGGGRVDTPIVALTASTLATDRERCLVAGMDDFIAKPVTLAELGAALTRWTVAAGRSRHSTLAGHPVLDASRLDSITGGDTADADPALARHLASVFLSSAPAHLAGLASAVRIGDAGAAARHAHALKGVCGSFGADGMAMLATQLDMLASAHELGTAEELVSSLHLELHGVRREVNSYLGALAASTGASAENGHAAGDQRVPR
jgi:CheY-like chemotaxis protein